MLALELRRKFPGAPMQIASCPKAGRLSHVAVRLIETGYVAGDISSTRAAEQIERARPWLCLYQVAFAPTTSLTSALAG